MSEFDSESDGQQWVHFEGQLNEGGDFSTDDIAGQTAGRFVDDIIPDQYAVNTEADKGFITASEFDVSRFGGLYTQDRTEGFITKLAFESALYALASEHVDLFETTKKMYTDGQQRENIEGMLEVRDDHTLAVVRLMLGHHPDAPPTPDASARGDAIVIKTYGTDGAETSYTGYYAGKDGVYKNVISLTPMAKILRPVEATEETRLKLAAEHVNATKELFSDARRAGLIDILVSPEEVGYLARFIAQAKPQTITFRNIFFKAAQELQSPRQPDINAALTAAPLFAKYVQRHLSKDGFNRLTDDVAQAEVIALEAQPLKNIAVKHAEAEIGYEESSQPYIKLRLNTQLSEDQLDRYTSHLVREGIMLTKPSAQVAERHHEIKIGINPDFGHLELVESINTYGQAGNALTPQYNASRPTTPYAATLVRNFIKKPIFKTARD